MTDMTVIRREVVDAIERIGPMLGKELVEQLPERNYLELWQACFTSPDILISHFSRYYLRYDITREDSIRLSPSILRDFLSFTLFSTSDQRTRD